MLRLVLTLIAVAFVLGLLGFGMASADEPTGPNVYYFQRSVDGLHMEYAVVADAGVPAPSEADYVSDSAKLPGGRGTFFYNPAGAPSWAGTAPSIPAALAMWNGITPNLALTFAGASAAPASLCASGTPDGQSVIAWGPTAGTVIAMACWWGTGECDVILGSGGFSGDMKTVLAHELGHCLGLGHPPDHPEALMWYLYHGPMAAPSLDDVNGVCALYGGCGVFTPTPQPSATSTASATATPYFTPTPTPQPAPTAWPRGCLRYVGLPFCTIFQYLAKD